LPSTIILALSGANLALLLVGFYFLLKAENLTAEYYARVAAQSELRGIAVRCIEDQEGEATTTAGACILDAIDEKRNQTMAARSAQLSQ